jgi:hypothetical protein
MSIQGWSLHDSRPEDTFLGDMQELSIFSRLSTMAHMSILIVDSKSLREIKSIEYNIMDM